jgi:circadian clock protein KaiC
VRTTASPARAVSASSPRAKTRELTKVPTGIVGLDDVLRGGVPAGRMTLLSGGPGSGKSLIALQCALHGATEGKPGILVLFEERATAVRQNVLSLGWDMRTFERNKSLFLLDARVNPEAVISGDFSIKGLLAILDQQVKALRARFIVFDAVDTLLRLYDNPTRERNELNALHEWLLDRGLTAIMTVKADAQEVSPSRYSFLDFMADCVIVVDQRVTVQVATRRLRVVKYRGSGYGRNEYPFIIGENGIEVVPITSSTLRHRAPGVNVSSGQIELDGVLGGGYKRGTGILIVGTAGAGKTTLACLFAEAACRRGERVLYLNFEESVESMVTNMRSTGLNLQRPVDSGRLVIQSWLPEATGVEEHLLRALKGLDEFRPAHLIVDAISACERMGTKHAAFEYLMRVLDACKQRGITCVYINQATSADVVSEISGIGISSIIDSVIVLRHLTVDGKTERQLIVMKSRGTKHSTQFHDFQITDGGITLTEA